MGGQQCLKASVDLEGERAVSAPAEAPHLRYARFGSFLGLWVAVIEGWCALLILLKGTTLFLGFTGLLTAAASSWLHSDAVRMPLMALAAGSVALNAYLLWNFFRLRRSPAARWRVQPLSRRERFRVAVVMAASVLTLIFLIAEIYGHRMLNA